jgi:hypothetical protein
VKPKREPRKPKRAAERRAAGRRARPAAALAAQPSLFPEL